MLFIIAVLAATRCPYRLGDIVKQYPGADVCACVHKESVGCMYLAAAPGKNNLTALASILRGRLLKSPWLRASPLVAHIHVRAGDGIIGPDCFHNKSECFVTKAGYYSRTKAYFDTLTIPRLPLVVHATTRHHTAHFRGIDGQANYLSDVLAYLAQFGPVIPKINAPVDDTFTELSTSCNLMVTGGGFSALARSLAQQHFCVL